MKQKTIIQVWGTQGGGKSTTIKVLREELLINYINPAHSYIMPLPSGEISEILICNGLKVGIESLGDDLWSYGLKSRLDNFVITDNCDLIICASRVHNNVTAHIKYLADTYGYRLLKVTNYRGDEPPFIHNDLNQLSAQHFLLLITQILTGTI